MKKNPKIDAVFCANDTTALSSIIFLKSNGFKVPDDVLVMGFSNEPFSEVVTPSISTVQQPGFLMGKKAATLLIGQLKSKSRTTEFQTIVMPTDLLIRESSVRK
jgi:LacI family transcriptional regulator